MPGHLVVVVHGIGEQAAGETVDAVLAGAIAEHERSCKDVPVTVETEVMEVPKRPFPPLPSPQTDAPAEDAPEDAAEVAAKDTPAFKPKKEREVGHFPMHLRHVRSVNEPKASATTFVDMYWADISPAPKGQVWIILDFVRTLLGIGYLAMENVRSHGTRLSFGLVSSFVWTFFAVIASINLMLVIGLGLLVLEGWAYRLDLQYFVLGTEAWSFFDSMDQRTPLVRYDSRPDAPSHFLIRPEFLVILTGCVTAVLGGSLRYFQAKTLLARQFAWGLFVVGLVVLSYGLISLVVPEIAFDPNPGLVVTQQPRVYINQFVDYVVVILSLFWLLALFICLLMYATTGWEARTPPIDATSPDEKYKERKGHRRIYASVCSALILLWMIFASSFWVFVEAVISNNNKGAENADVAVVERQIEAARSWPLAWNAQTNELVEVQTVQRRPDPSKGADAEGSSAFQLTRLLDTELAEALGGMTTAVSLAVILVLVIAYTARVHGRNRANLDEDRFERSRRFLLNTRLQWVFALSTPTIFVIAAFHVLDRWDLAEAQWLASIVNVEHVKAFMGELAAFVGALRGWDGLASVVLLGFAFVITTFHDAVGSALGIMRDITVYSTTEKHERWHPQSEPPSEEENANYLIRKDIEARFTRVLELMIWSKRPERVTIISHSLGTIVATRCLGKWLERNSLPDGTLITMGSPVTHIYRRYFYRHFEIGEGLSSDKMDWINIFRKDDFVGTYIDGLKRRVCNRAVAPGGHSGYFTDEEVWDILRTRAGFTLEPMRATPSQGGAQGPSGGEGGIAQDQDADPTGREDHGAGRHLSEASDHADGMGDAQTEEDQRRPVGQG